MTESLNGDIESIAAEMANIDQDVRVRAFFRLLRVADVVNKYIEIGAAKVAMTPTSIAVILALLRHGGIVPQKDMAKEVWRSKQTVARVLDQLEREGVAKRLSVDKDHRVRNVMTTRKGLNRMKERIPLRFQISHAALSCLSQEEVEQLSAISRKLTRHLANLTGTTSGPER